MTRLARTVLAAAFCVVVAVLLGAVSPAFAAAVQPAYDPPVGSRWKIVTEGHEQKLQDGKPSESATWTRAEELTIVEKTADGFRISSVLRESDYRGGRAETGANALLAAIRGVVVHAVVDRTGKPVRIENFDEVVAAHKEGVNRMVASFSDKPEVRAKLRELLDTILAKTAGNPNDAAQAYLETLAQLSLAQTTGLKLGEERRSAQSAPNLAGGEPIKTNVVLRLVELDPAGGQAKLVRTQAYDPAAMKEFTVAFAKKLVDSATSAEIEKIVGQMALSMDDRTEFAVEHGMARSVTDDSSLSVKAMGHEISKQTRQQITVTAMP